MFVIIRSDISYELSTVARRDKTLPIIQDTSQNSKTLSQNPKTTPRINPNTLPRIQYLVPGSVLDYGHVFGFWHVYLDSGKFSHGGAKTTPQMSIKAKFTYLLHFFSFLGQTCQIDYDC